MIITDHPLHRSGRAELPHPALALGNDAHAFERIGMAYTDWGQVAFDQPFHSFPEDSPLLAAAREGPMPETSDLEAEQEQRRGIHGHPVVLQVSLEHTAQPLSDFREGVMHPLPEFGIDLSQLRLEPRPLDLAQDRKHSIGAFAAADRGEAQEVEGLGFSLSPASAVAIGKGAELDETGLVWMQFQGETGQTLAQRSEEGLRFGLALESHDEVVGIPHDDHIALGLALAPLLDPEVKDVVEVDIGQEGADAPALNRARLAEDALAVFQHACVQPFADETQDPPVRNAVFEECKQPSSVEGIEKSADVCVEPPVHLSRQQGRIERVQRLMGATLWAARHPPCSGNSRFPCMVLLRIRQVSDRVGLRCVSRYRRPVCGFPHPPTASAPQRKVFSRLHTGPTRSSVNASVAPLRAPPYDSGPLWFAKPSTYDSFIHYTMLV